MNNIKKCSGWCPPTVIYVSLSTLSILLSFFQVNKKINDKGSVSIHEHKINNTLLHVVSTLFWGTLMYWLCSKCHLKTAWLVLLFPLIFLVTLLLGLFLLSSHKE